MELNKILELTTKTLTKPNQNNNPIPSLPNPISNPSITIPNPYKAHSLINTFQYWTDPHPKITRITKTFNKFNEI